MEMITVAEIATLLNMKRSSDSQVILFLGSRAGGFFRSEALYDNITKLSKTMSKFETLTTIEKFGESYRVLTEQTENTVYDILYASLKGLDMYRREDECLMELVKEGYFDLIISTNADDFLEYAFDQGKLREPHHYHVFIPGIHLAQDGVQRKVEYCTIVKVFGDFVSRRYTIATNEFDFNADRDLRDFLLSALARNVLVIGYDPIWDQPIELVFPQARKGDFWFVNEEAPKEDSSLARTIQRRQGKHLIGRQGSYKNFIQALHLELLQRNPHSLEAFKEILHKLDEIYQEISTVKALLKP